MKTPQPTEKTSDAPQKLTRKISELPEPHYGVLQDGRFYDFNPAQADIQRAIDEKRFDARGFQTHKEELKAEWLRDCNESADEYCRLQKEYHAARIAYFVVTGWIDPIKVAANGDMIDGAHRLKAAKFMGKDEVEIRIAQ